MLARTSSLPRREGLGARRKRWRRRLAIALLIFAVIALGAAVWGLWQESVRISRFEVFGTDAALEEYAFLATQGSYLGVVPRDSIFFFPERSIRRAILDDHPEIAAVSIFRSGFDGISIKAEPRIAIGRWCGLSPTPDVDEYCYVFDANGYVFAPAASTTQTVNIARLYAPLAGETLEPLRATIAPASDLPSVFDFARQLGTIGAKADAVVIRGDEVDDILASGTRITYVLGHEQAAFTALVSGKEKVNLSDGSLEYVDLRFDGKVYLKRKE